VTKPLVPKPTTIILGYMGPDPGSAVSLAKKILVLSTISAIVRRAQTKVSPKVVWEGVGTRFFHTRDVLMWEIGA